MTFGRVVGYPDRIGSDLMTSGLCVIQEQSGNCVQRVDKRCATRGGDYQRASPLQLDLGKQECFGLWSATADLERAEILVPLNPRP